MYPISNPSLLRLFLIMHTQCQVANIVLTTQFESGKKIWARDKVNAYFKTVYEVAISVTCFVWFVRVSVHISAKYYLVCSFTLDGIGCMLKHSWREKQYK